MNHLRLRSLRARSAAAAGAAVLLGSALIGALALALVQTAGARSLDAALQASTADVLAQLQENPPSSGDPVQLPPLDPADPVVVQIVDAAGEPVATTPGVATGARVCATPAGTDAESVELDQPGLSGTFRVMATHVETGGDSYTVCAARNDESAEATRLAVLAALAAAILAVTALVVLFVTRGVGTALSAVSALTQEADRLGTLDAGRLTIPDTGDEIERLAVTFNALLDRLHEQQQATRRFVADAGHELRTPLASLRLDLELAELDASPRAVPSEAISDVDRLAALVDDLLVLARADAGEPADPVPVRLPDTLLDEIQQAGRLAPEVAVSMTGDPCEAMVDEQGLRRAVRNLLTNAVRHARTDVHVRIHSGRDRISIEVLDDGPGLPPDQTERVFERFTRLDDARSRDAGGSGLGLAIVAEFARQNHGSARAYPGPSGRFVLQVPCADEVHRP